MILNPDTGKLESTIFHPFAVLCNDFETRKLLFDLCGKVNRTWFRGHEPESITLVPVIRLLPDGQHHVNLTPVECSAFAVHLDPESHELTGERTQLRELADFSFVDELPRTVPFEDLQATGRR